MPQRYTSGQVAEITKIIQAGLITNKSYMMIAEQLSANEELNQRIWTRSRVVDFIQQHQIDRNLKYQKHGEIINEY